MGFDRDPCSRIVCILAGIAILADCSGGGPTGTTEPPPTMVTVTTETSVPARFIPRRVTVAVGGTVTWRNTSPSPIVHNVFSMTGAFLSPDLDPGDTFEVTFPTAGTFNYECLIHDGMTGTVTVE